MQPEAGCKITWWASIYFTTGRHFARPALQSRSIHATIDSRIAGCAQMQTDEFGNIECGAPFLVEQGGSQGHLSLQAFAAEVTRLHQYIG